MDEGTPYSGCFQNSSVSFSNCSVSFFNRLQMMAILEALLKIIPQELAEGNIVELGDFGNFWLKANSEGAGTSEEVRATRITTLLPRFNLEGSGYG